MVGEYVSGQYIKHATFEFSRDRKSMSVLVEKRGGHGSGRATRSGGAGSGELMMYVKGAPESILERCTTVRQGSKTVPFSAGEKIKMLATIAEWGSKESLRVLAFATVDSPATAPGKRVEPGEYAKLCDYRLLMM
jgi:Ca2+ transporting ATPase